MPDLQFRCFSRQLQQLPNCLPRKTDLAGAFRRIRSVRASEWITGDLRLFVAPDRPWMRLNDLRSLCKVHA